MADNQGLHLTTIHESPDNFPDLARQIVRDWAVEGLGVPESTAFYVVWFNFTLGNWKAMVSSTEADGRYYEVTHRVNSGRVFIDTYLKTHNNLVNLVEKDHGGDT